MRVTTRKLSTLGDDVYRIEKFINYNIDQNNEFSMQSDVSKGYFTSCKIVGEKDNGCGVLYVAKFPHYEKFVDSTTKLSLSYIKNTLLQYLVLG